MNGVQFGLQAGFNAFFEEKHGNSGQQLPLKRE
jgi:hypothetical protein